MIKDQDERAQVFFGGRFWGVLKGLEQSLFWRLKRL